MILQAVFHSMCWFLVRESAETVSKLETYERVVGIICQHLDTSLDELTNQADTGEV